MSMDVDIMELFKYYLVGINIISFLLYGFDKILAMMKIRRIRERTLLMISILGGCYGGFLGMIIFRHKIRKKRFIILNLISIIVYSYIIWRTL